MYDIIRDDHFVKWLAGLRDRTARDRIDMRLRRLVLGNFGDWKAVGEGVAELRIDHGPGYRLYYGVRDRRVVILLVGGEKSSQRADIALAHRLWRKWSDGRDA